MFKMTSLAAVFVIGSATIAHAATILVGGPDNLHNGGLTAGATVGYWNGTPSGYSSGVTAPTGWVGAGSYIFQNSARVQASNASTATNNTGIIVTSDTQYTVTGLLGTNANHSLTVSIYATQNSDGTGASHLLAQAASATDPANTDSSNVPVYYALASVSATSATTVGALDGYYLQVQFATGNAGSGQNHFFRSVDVTSEVVPEPATAGLLGAGALMMAARRRRSI